jgi:hypothetical protein
MDQSAPSCVAQTDDAWQALLQNSSPTLTHLDAGGGVYAGGAVDSSIGVAATAGVDDDVDMVRPGGVPANMTSPA